MRRERDAPKCDDGNEKKMMTRAHYAPRRCLLNIDQQSRDTINAHASALLNFSKQTNLDVQP